MPATGKNQPNRVNLQSEVPRHFSISLGFFFHQVDSTEATKEVTLRMGLRGQS